MRCCAQVSARGVCSGAHALLPACCEMRGWFMRYHNVRLAVVEGALR